MNQYLKYARPLKNLRRLPFHQATGDQFVRPKFMSSRYFSRRYELFSRYDRNVKVDEEMLFSVMPEALARSATDYLFSLLQKSLQLDSDNPPQRGRIANDSQHSEESYQMKPNAQYKPTCLDLFGGAGGLAIQLAARFATVTVELSPGRCGDINHNCFIYNSELTVVNGDVFAQQERLIGLIKPDVITVSPPWGGTGYERTGFDIDYEIGGNRVVEIAEKVRECDCVKIVAFILPVKFKNAAKYQDALGDGWSLSIVDLERVWMLVAKRE